MEWRMAPQEIHGREGVAVGSDVALFVEFPLDKDGMGTPGAVAIVDSVEVVLLSTVIGPSLI